MLWATSIYVVGNEQIYHFDVLKRVLVRLGREWGNDIEHLSYGMVELPNGKMKSREGTVVDADDLMDEMVATAKSVSDELGKAKDLSPGEADKLYHTIGLGALKYFILKVDPKKTMLTRRRPCSSTPQSPSTSTATQVHLCNTPTPVSAQCCARLRSKASSSKAR